MIELSDFNLNGVQPFEEGLLSEADMLEVLGGDSDTNYNHECKFYSGCNV